MKYFNLDLEVFVACSITKTSQQPTEHQTKAQQDRTPTPTHKKQPREEKRITGCHHVRQVEHGVPCLPSRLCVKQPDPRGQCTFRNGGATKPPVKRRRKGKGQQRKRKRKNHKATNNSTKRKTQKDQGTNNKPHTSCEGRRAHGNSVK